MRSGALVSVALVMMVVMTTNASVLADPDMQLSTQGREGGGGSISVGSPSQRPCCDNCGNFCYYLVNKPPLCTCKDLLLFCPPWCKNCVRSPLKIHPPRYQCKDIIANYCKYRCTPKTLSLVE